MDADAAGGDVDAGEGEDLLRIPLLDDDGPPVRRRRVDGRRRRHAVERDPVGVGSDGQPVGAHLVGEVPVGGDAVGADEHPVHEPPRHEPRGGAVRRHLHRDPPRVQFQRREARPLEQRPRFVGDDAELLPRPLPREEDRQRRPVPGRGQGAGVAVGEVGPPVPQQPRPVGPHGAAEGRVLPVHRLRSPQRRPRRGAQRHRPAEPVHPGLARPEHPEGEVHRRRPRPLHQQRLLPEEDLRRGEVPVPEAPLRRQRHPVGPGHAQRRRAADGEAADGVHEGRHRGDPEHLDPAGEEGLVQEFEVAAKRPPLPAERRGKGAGAAHG